MLPCFASCWKSGKMGGLVQEILRNHPLALPPPLALQLPSLSPGICGLFRCSSQSRGGATRVHRASRHSSLPPSLRCFLLCRGKRLFFHWQQRNTHRHRHTPAHKRFFPGLGLWLGGVAPLWDCSRPPASRREDSRRATGRVGEWTLPGIPPLQRPAPPLPRSAQWPLWMGAFAGSGAALFSRGSRSCWVLA